MVADRILVVDDEPGVRSALEGILADEGFEVRVAASGEEGLAALSRERFDAVLLDVWLPGMDGLEALERMKAIRPDAEVVMISGHGTIETAVRATKLGAFDFVEKPLSLERTLLVLRNALRQQRLERSNRHLLEQLSRETEITGDSPAAVRLRAEVDAAALADAPVLIVGEPGSGRQTIARRIHARGATLPGPFVELPCQALDAPAARQALFGHAGGDRGRLALAAGGSLFLEEVHRMRADLQADLAAALKARATGRVRPLRLLASTVPAAAGLEPALRPLLDVIRVEVPALRERRADIPALAERFLIRAAGEYARPPRRLMPGCREALAARGWPGNLEELRELMDRLAREPGPAEVDAADLPAPPDQPS